MWDTQHLQKVHTGYFRHFILAMGFNLLAVGVLITGIIHAFIPWLFPFTPYRLAKKITTGTEKYFMSHVERK